MVAELLEFYGRFHKQSYGWDGSPIHDAVAMAHAFKPGIVETRTRRREGRLRRGARPRPDELRPARPGRRGSRTPHVAVGIDADAFIALLVERISSLG